MREIIRSETGIFEKVASIAIVVSGASMGSIVRAMNGATAEVVVWAIWGAVEAEWNF